MKSTFLPRLINGPFGDPGLHITLRWCGRAVQFDLGSLDRFPPASILRISHIFISHTHIDHFIGFDRVLRLFLTRDVELAVFGPPGIIANVRGKLAGYTWNLVDGYRFAIRVHEVFPDHLESVLLPACDGFQPGAVARSAASRVIFEEAAFWIECAHLDHRICSLAYAIAEPAHLNVRKDALERYGLIPGPWLNRLKEMIRAEREPATPLEIMRQGTEKPETAVATLGDLRRDLIVETPGQRLVYVVDALFSRRNMDEIVALASGADVLFCESLFLDEDREEALRRAHLTARQAGTLARMAGVKRLRTFHFSPRYEEREERLREEAEAAFRGEIAPDQPV